MEEARQNSNESSNGENAIVDVSADMVSGSRSLTQPENSLTNGVGPDDFREAADTESPIANGPETTGVSEGGQSTLLSHEDASGSDPDPLEIRQLALSYDYLIYKIRDHISCLADSTYTAITEKEQRIKTGYFENQLQLKSEVDRVNSLIDSCKAIEADFLKLDQLRFFIADFRRRLDALEQGFRDLET